MVAMTIGFAKIGMGRRVIVMRLLDARLEVLHLVLQPSESADRVAGIWGGGWQNFLSSSHRHRWMQKLVTHPWKRCGRNA
jgi:hypothetical protein